MIVKILLNSTASDLNRVYDYLAPEELEISVEIGKRVFVKFGVASREEEGIIVKIEDDSYESKYRLKKIKSILDDKSYISKDRLKLAKWMSHLYFCNVYDALKLMLPPGTNSLSKSKNLITNTTTILTAVYERNYILDKIHNNEITSANHIRLLEFIYSNNLVSVNDVKEGLNISNSIINTVVKNGYLKKEKIKIDKDIIDLDSIVKTFPLEPTYEQEEAIDNISSNLDTFNTSLLFGVTGSGKTEVYLQVIDKVLKKGKTAIVLVPEISLTHQTMTRFISRFGNIVSVIHSRMTVNERKDEYLKILQGKTKIVVGARSALFSPISNLGIVIIDEEHDSSYISNSTPRYNTKEVAEYVCRNSNCPLLLGSATPSINTYYNCKNERYNLYEMRSRPKEFKLPTSILVDKKIDKLDNRGLFTSKVINEIGVNLKNNEKTMILINRRGYSSYLKCNDCNEVFKCPHCDVSMTYHKTNNLLICHYCNHVIRNVKNCNKCNSSNISASVSGIQKYEEELKNIFKDANIIRMDRDTTMTKNAHNNILEEFKDEGDILIGTQMISKGHDIKDVTLVVVLGTDSMLNMNDYSSSFAAYSNISQVSGRAGRGEKSGRVLIETEDVENSILGYALEHNYDGYYNDEISFRNAFKYPPFTDLFIISMSSKDYNVLKEESIKFYDILNKSNKYIVSTPKSPYVQKVKNNFRISIVIKGKLSNDILKDLYNKSSLYDKVKNKKIKYSIIRNPINM